MYTNFCIRNVFIVFFIEKCFFFLNIICFISINLLIDTILKDAHSALKMSTVFLIVSQPHLTYLVSSYYSVY